MMSFKQRKVDKRYSVLRTNKINVGNSLKTLSVSDTSSHQIQLCTSIKHQSHFALSLQLPTFASLLLAFWLYQFCETRGRINIPAFNFPFEARPKDSSPLRQNGKPRARRSPRRNHLASSATCADDGWFFTFE